MPDNIKKKINDLKKEIKSHNKLYYVKGDPAISDSKYDGLIEELKSLEKKYPEYITADSPTQTVGAPIPEKFKKVKHLASMLSLDSVNDKEGALHFDETCKKAIGKKIDYICEPKLDGISIELVYENGNFAQGSTRGNGLVGEDVTLNLKTIQNIPLNLKGSHVPERLAVRGEVMMHISDFQKLNKKQTEEGKDAFANPRNVVAGSMRQLDYRITASRKLHVYSYRILDVSGGAPSSQKESLDFLKELGFQVSPGVKYCKNMKEAISYHHSMEEKRDSLDYEIDGVVVKVNSFSYQDKLGVRTTNPKWAVAYKFKPRKEITRVEDILIQVGRTGVLTPLALLQPVEVGGVTVSRASLHNMDQIERLGIKIGDYVKVERAGDVIPYISEVVKEKRKGKEKRFSMLKKCPSCGSHIEKEDVFFRCTGGFGCPAQAKEAIIHYASKGAVDIEGFSEKTVELLFDKEIIASAADIYALKEEDLLLLEGWKEKKTANILKAIEKARKIPLERFIFGLGIKNVGKHIATLLANKFGTLDNLAKAKEEELTEINEIGPEIAKEIVSFFSEKRNNLEIDKLKKNGVVIKEKKKLTKGKFLGKKFVFTGTLQKMTREEAKKLVEAEGGELASSVTSSTDFVVAGEKAGSKLEKARKNGIKILTEKEFQALI